MKVPFVDLKRQYASIKAEVDAAIQRVLNNTSFIGGEEVSSFEKAFAEYCSARHAVGVASGTSALYLALMAHNVGKGDEVITVPNTFTATAEAIVIAGAKPVFVDIDPKTHTLNPEALAAAVNKKTKAIIPIHLYGQPANMSSIMDVAEEKGLVVIEDAAQAHGAEYRGKRIGSLSTACFSFYPGKNLGAYGDAGCVTTDDGAVAEKIRMLRDHGRSEKYEHKIVGFNERLDALQAAILKVKLKHIEDWTSARRKNARKYGKLLQDSSVETPFEADYVRHVYHLYVIKTENRDELQTHLKTRGVSTGIHYPIPLHLQPAYSGLGYKPGSFPVSEEDAEKILSLPMFAELSREEIEFVCGGIAEFRN
jgi:dTDP-4-amino-4,6-dideoxygalactose transaminase